MQQGVQGVLAGGAVVGDDLRQPIPASQGANPGQASPAHQANQRAEGNFAGDRAEGRGQRAEGDCGGGHLRPAPDPGCFLLDLVPDDVVAVLQERRVGAPEGGGRAGRLQGG